MGRGMLRGLYEMKAFFKELRHLTREVFELYFADVHGSIVNHVPPFPDSTLELFVY